MIPLQDKQNTEAPSADYPYGELKDKNGSIAGTPANVALFNDIMQFAERLMDLGQVTANGLPDNEYSGWQLMEALLNLTVRRKVIEIGLWNMDSTLSVSVAHGLDLGTTAGLVDKIRGCKVMILNDDQDSATPLDIWDGASAVGGAFSIDDTNVILVRTPSSYYDSNLFDAAVNRGYIVIEYVE